MGFENWAKVAGGKSNGVQGVRKSKGSKSRTNPSAANSGGQRSNKVARRTRKSDRGDQAVSTKNFEKEWQAESDLDALTRAAAIVDSPERVQAARKKALERAKQAQEAADSLNNIGG